jgi:hypothetical protein
MLVSNWKWLRTEEEVHLRAQLHPIPPPLLLLLLLLRYHYTTTTLLCPTYPKRPGAGHKSTQLSKRPVLQSANATGNASSGS